MSDAAQHREETTVTGVHTIWVKIHITKKKI